MYVVSPIDSRGNPRVPNRWYTLEFVLAAASGTDSDFVELTEDVEILEIGVDVFADSNATEVFDALSRVSAKITMLNEKSPTANEYVPLNQLGGTGQNPRHVSIEAGKRDKITIDARHDGNAGNDLNVRITLAARVKGS